VRVPKDKRAALIAALDQQGIASEIYYPRGLHQQPALADFAPQEALPQTERATCETLALPLYPELSFDDIERVVDTVSETLKIL
jgi:dTDP-4-amino-4,6-dideoxygalactose transaminase